MDQKSEGARVASHRMPDRDRPRRAVPAWVVAPPEDTADDREARPTAAPQATVAEAVASSPVPAPGPEVAAAGSAVVAAGSAVAGASAAEASAAPVAVPTGPLSDVDVVVPDYPPQEHLLPPAPTSPAVQVPSFDTAPLPVSPADGAAPSSAAAPVAAAPGTTGPGTTASGPAAGARGVTAPAPAEQDRTPLAPPTDPSQPAPRHTTTNREPAQPAAPATPVVGQPRFSVPGLEHVLVEGTEPEPSGPIGYRTPARFARQQAPRPVTVEPAPTTFDAVIAPPATTAAAPTAVFPAVHGAATDEGTHAADPAATGAATRAEAAATDRDGGRASLQAGDRASRDRSRTALGATPAAVLGAVAGTGALGLAAWWFTAPATVHAAGLVLGVLALVLSGTALRHPAATWQRPVALLGAVLGGVGTLVLLWAVASALLPLAGVTLPDLTGTGVVPTVAP